MENRNPASIRGVPFFVDDGDLSFGRRVASHEYPYRDNPWTDDLGRKQRSFTLNAFILGEDVESQRKALIYALEQQGTAILVHTRLGQLRVQVGECRWRMSSRSDREDFSIECLEPNDEAQTQTSTNTLVDLQATVSSNLATHSQAFSERFTVENQLQFVLDDASDFVTTGLDTLREINGRLQGAIAPVSDIAFAIDSIGNELSSLIRTPQVLASAIGSVVSQTFGLLSDVDTALDSYSNMQNAFSAAEPIPNITTPTRQQQADNRAAVQDLFKRASLSATVNEIAQQADGINISDVSQSPFTSYDHAITVRDDVVQSIGAEMETADYDSYDQLAQLQSHFHAHIEAHGVSLPRVNTLAIRRLEPTLVIAYRLYASANRADDIVARNGLKHPLFVDNKALEVASA